MTHQKVWLKAYLTGLTVFDGSLYTKHRDASEIADKCLLAFKAQFKTPDVTPIGQRSREQKLNDPTALFMDKEQMPSVIKSVLEKCGFNIKHTVTDTENYYELVREDVIFFSCDYKFDDLQQLYTKIFERQDKLIGDYS